MSLRRMAKDFNQKSVANADIQVTSLTENPERMEAFSYVIQNASTIIIENDNCEGIPGWADLNSEDQFDQFANEDSLYGYYIGYKKLFGLRVSNNKGDNVWFPYAQYLNGQIIVDYKLPPTSEYSPHENLFKDFEVDFRLPKLYGNSKIEVCKALNQNMTIVIGLLKKKGFWIPFGIVDEFCTGERTHIFFNKKRTEKKTPPISLSEAKKLLDEGALTQKEFETIKRRILETI